MNNKIFYGPDISVHNGEVDFGKIKDKYDFVILRCGFGSDLISQDDENFIRNAEECEKLSIPYGVYLYSYANTVKKAESEARHVLRLIKGRKIDCGIWYDVEDKIMPENKELLQEICITFLEAMENEGYYAGLYSSLSRFKERLNSEKLDVYDKWVAQWNDTDDYEKPHGMWQFTDKAEIKGLNGKFDMNAAYKNYPEITANMKKNTMAEPFKVRVKAKNGLNIRKGAGTGFNIIGALSPGDIVTITKTDNGWGKLESGGYISMNYTEKYKEPITGTYIVNAKNGLNLRQTPGTERFPLCKLPNGTKVEVKNIENNWAEIEYTLKAYVSMDYLEKEN